MNLGRMLAAAAALHPDRPAVTCEGRQWTYAEFMERADRLAEGLRVRCEVRPGDRVVIWLSNCAEYLEILVACWRLGAVVVPVNARLRVKEVEFHCRHSEARVLFHDADRTEQAAQVDVPHRVFVGAGDGNLSHESLQQVGSLDNPVEVEESSPAWVFYTSGTTGSPKGAVLSHANLTAMIVAWCADLHTVSPEDVVLHCAPLSHAAGFYAVTALARGASSIIHRRFDAGAVLREIALQRVTATWMVPTQLRLTMDVLDADSDLSSLTHVIYGGAPILRCDLEEAIAKFGPVLCQLYGQGESPMTITSLPRREHMAGRDDEALVSAGFARTGVDVRIETPHGGWAVPDEVGEIVVRGPTVMVGYLGDEAATRETLRDDYLHTGDIGRIDERGYLYVLDRAKDLIISGGSNVYAKSVEDVLAEYPGVDQVAVFGVPDRLWGEAVTAAVVASNGVDAEDILRHCRERIADYQVPKSVVFVEDLPKNAYGKILKRELRDRFAPRATATPTPK
jgi:long-chain acyl-CoA synthetase